eukprot:scaffold4990_cov387-Prasinococcus_capsulatus_cf.AAC.30
MGEAVHDECGVACTPAHLPEGSARWPPLFQSASEWHPSLRSLSERARRMPCLAAMCCPQLPCSCWRAGRAPVQGRAQPRALQAPPPHRCRQPP